MSAHLFLVSLLTHLLTSSLTQLSSSYLVRQVGPSTGSREPIIHPLRVEDSLSSGFTTMPGKALSLFFVLVPRDTHLASTCWHNWKSEKVRELS